MNEVKTTPMMRQYLDIKGLYADYILFYRMGDFYEMFLSDAETASRELEITLTARNKNDESPIPMCGVPVKAADVYIGRLIEKGYKVAICEQTEDPAAAKGLVKREVVRVVTPGMVLSSELLDERTNNFVLSIYIHNSHVGLSCLDLSTAAFRVSESTDANAVVEEAHRIAPSEILLPEKAETDPEYALFTNAFSQQTITFLAEDHYHYDTARRRLLEQFKTRSLEGFGCETLSAGVGAAGALLHYVRETQKQEILHIPGIETYFLNHYLLIDDVSCRNLELLKNIGNQTRQGTLLGIIDMTVTAMGGRLIKRWLQYPLIDPGEIKSRLDAVEAAVSDGAARKLIREHFKSVADLERVSSKISMGQANARDLIALKRSISALPDIIGASAGFDASLLFLDPVVLPPLYELAETIKQAIVDDPPPTINEGGMIRTGYDAGLDELIQISRDGRHYLAQLEAKEREQTGISTLKVRYNKVFGYYIEVTKSNAAAVPAHYVRKQTLVNAERYITDELKTFETKVLGAQEQRAVLEYEIFSKIRAAVSDKNPQLLSAAAYVACLDCILSLAEVAVRNGYSRPEINTEGIIHIEEGRHPVIEKLIPAERFVPNTLHLDNNENQILIITGPNMAGKSTVLRQTALMVLMAQMGSYVPAHRADISITDRIFTRVGALDNLSQGQSTFMVEMEETANIMNNATPKSLVIMDEIGRGTSTYDGLSIAWAVAEYLHDIHGVGVRSLFATHYHELTELARIRPRVKNFSIAVKEWNDEIIFLHRLVEGGTNRSYGIQVARLAGIPERIVKRAKAVLANIETSGHVLEKSGGGRRKQEKGGFVQLPLFRQPEEIVMEKLRKIDISNMTPIDAINYLSMLKAKVTEEAPADIGGQQK